MSLSLAANELSRRRVAQPPAQITASQNGTIQSANLTENIKQFQLEKLLATSARTRTVRGRGNPTEADDDNSWRRLDGILW